MGKWRCGALGCRCWVTYLCDTRSHFRVSGFSCSKLEMRLFRYMVVLCITTQLYISYKEGVFMRNKETQEITPAHSQMSTVDIKRNKPMSK